MTCKAYVCGLPFEQREEFIPAPSMETLANKFGDYRCPAQQQEIDVSVMLMYFSAVVAYVLLAMFGDYLGRKRIMQAGLILSILGLAVSLLAVNLLMGAAGMFLSCLGC